MLEVFADATLPSGAKILWMYIMLYGGDGAYTATHEELAAGTGLGRSSVIRCVKVLEAKELVTVQRASGGATSNIYFAHLPK